MKLSLAPRSTATRDARQAASSERESKCANDSLAHQAIQLDEVVCLPDARHLFCLIQSDIQLNPIRNTTMSSKPAFHLNSSPEDLVIHNGAKTREELIELLNQDLSREYQAIIAYIVYSQAIRGAKYMAIAGELEKHAHEELAHALIIAKQVDYLGGMPSVTPQQVKTSKEAEQMLLYDMENENVTVRNYRERVRQCEALGEFAIAEQIRDILVNEQEHQIDLATALGKDVAELAHLGQ